MPTVEVEGKKTFTTDENKKLVLAIEDAGIDIMHRCGGIARCTTCRVEVLSGTVSPMGEAETEALKEPELIAKYRLSCQVRVTDDLKVRLWKTATDEGITPGERPED